MRARTIVLLVAVLLVAGFAALNWSEVIRTTPLSFGLAIVEAPLGLILLTLLAIVTIAFIAANATTRTQALIESRQHTKALEAQRTLAEKAEASRFNDLRQHMDAQLRDNRQREAMAAAEFEKSMFNSQRELRNQLEAMNRTLAARLSEIEGRIDARLDRLHGTPAVQRVAEPEPVVVRDPVRPF
jgi:DNA anti-recombination protein RmuC